MSTPPHSPSPDPRAAAAPDAPPPKAAPNRPAQTRRRLGAGLGAGLGSGLGAGLGAGLKPLMPRGLYGRGALILAVPVLVMQLVVSVMVIQRLYEDVTAQMTRSLVSALIALVEDVNASPDTSSARYNAARLAASVGVSMTLPAGGPIGDDRDLSDLSGRTVIAVLREGLPSVTGIDLSASRSVRLAVTTRHGLLALEFDRRRVSASNPHQLIVLMGVTGLVMTGVSFLFLRNQLRPIRKLAEMAEAFGRGRNLPYRLAGAAEVRSAGAAFLDMRARIERQIEQRTLILSGVSHDLRTPLTRMKLTLAMMPEDEDSESLAQDVAEMQRLVDAFLAFTRGEAMDGDPVPCDPVALAAEAVERAARVGQTVTMTGPDQPGDLNLPLRPDAIHRALDNLIGNAARYAGRAEVSVSHGEKSVVIAVEDDGPGIPRDRRDEALRPFSRLDAARNQDGGSGVGLGLAIAADAARGHGGMLRLSESPRLGGLRAEIVLPR